MNMPSLPCIRHSFCLLFLSFFISFQVQASPFIEQAVPFTISPFYLLLIGVAIHLPFVLIAFFYAINASNYSDRKHQDVKTGLGILLLINGSIFVYLFYHQYYLYPSLILFFVPILFLILGIFRSKHPFINWFLSVLYMSTVVFLVLGGIYNHQGYGPKEGIYITYYNEFPTQIKSKQHYNFGRLDGISEQFHSNGQLKSSLTYNLDTLDGLAKEFYDNGQLKVAYKNHRNQIHGVYLSYYDNGQTKVQHNFVKGKLVGRQKTYYKNGRLKNSCYYKNNIGTYQSYYNNGQLKEEGQLNNNRKEGLWKTYHQNGQLSSTGLYLVANEKQSAKHGDWRTYYSNGQLQTSGKYKRGTRQGQWFKFFEDGGQSDYKNYG